MNDGSTAEYARVYAEQQPRLVAYARSLTRNSWTADDIVAEAHFRVWRRLSAGHEIDNVPAYLMTTVRRLATAAGGAVRETPQDPQTDERAEAGAHGHDPAERVSSVDLLTRVLGELPERWVKALWLAEAEGQPLAAIGPQLGTREGATAVLLHRAREGMRQAFLRTQTGAPDDPACQVHWARMPAYVRGNATARQSERLLGHVDACDDCRERLALLMQTNSKLPALIGPALLVFAVGGAGKWLLSGAAGVVGSTGAAVGGASGAGASGAGGGAGASGSAASGAGASSGASAGSGAGAGASAGGSGGASAGAAGSAGGHGAAAGLAGGHGSAAGVAGGHGGAAGLAGGGHGGGLLHGVKSAVAGGAKAPVAVAAGAAVAGAVAICIALGSVDSGPVTVDKGSVRETPVAQAPVGQPETGDGTATPGTTEGTQAPRPGSTPSDVPVPVSYDVGDTGPGAATPVPIPPPLPPVPPTPTPIPTPTSAPSGGPGTPAPEPTSPEPSTPEPSAPEPTSPEPTYPEPTSPEPTKPVEEPTEPAPSPSPTDDCPPPVQSAPRYPV